MLKVLLWYEVVASVAECKGPRGPGRGLTWRWRCLALPHVLTSLSLLSERMGHVSSCSERCCRSSFPWHGLARLLRTLDALHDLGKSRRSRFKNLPGGFIVAGVGCVTLEVVKEG